MSRDERGPDDTRDERDVRRPDDPRDVRDARLPSDPVDAVIQVNREAEASAKHSSHFGRWIALVVAVGLAAVSFTAWQVSSLRHREDQRLCEQIVAERRNDRAMWIWLFETYAESAAEVRANEELDERLPLLHCADNIPMPIDKEEP